MINSPLELSACVIWLDGSNSNYLKQQDNGTGSVSDGDLVGYWQNLGSLSSVGHFTANTNKPFYVASLSSVRFNGTSLITFTANITYTSQTTFVVTRTNGQGSGANNGIYTQQTDGTGQDYNVFLIPLNTLNVVSRISNTNRSTTNFRNLSTFDVFSSVHTGTNLTNFRNGESTTSFAHTLGNLNIIRSRLGSGIGATGGANGNYVGDIAEVIVYNRTLTNLERADVEYYLTKKWSVLNTIPRQVYAVKNGVWSDTATWSVSGYESPWGLPASIDDVYSNSFTVTAEQNAFVQSLRTTTLSPNIAAGGTFAIAQPNITITAFPSGFLAGTTTCVTGLLSSGTSVLSGNATGGSTAGAHGVSLQNTGNLTINGNILGGTQATAYGAFHNSTGNLIIVGNISGSATAVGAFNSSTGNIIVNAPQVIQGGTTAGCNAIQNNSVGSIYVTGNVLGGTNATARGILNSSVGLVNVTGNVSAGTVGEGIVQSSTGTLLINGNIFAGPAQHGVVSANTAARNEFTGALINSDNGRQAAYVARYLLRPKVFESYTYHKNTEIVNLLTFSEQIDNAAWVKTATTVTANVSANPLNNAFTGDRLVETATTNAHLTYRSFSTNLSGLSSSTDTTFRPLDLVFSIYARQDPNNRRFMVLGIDSGSTAGATSPNGLGAISVIYDLQTGTMPALTATGTGVVTLSSIENVGGGWYRCMIEGRINQPVTPWNIFPTIAISDRGDYSGTRVTTHYPSYAGNTLSGIAIWGAQFEYNSLTPYVSSEVFQGFENRSTQPMFFYSPEAYALSYVPQTSSVKLGTTYAAVSTLSGTTVNITEQLTGTMIVPSPQVVSYNVSVNDTVGTALHSAEDVWNVTLSSLTTDNSIGTRIANSVTFTEVGSALQTLRF